MDVYLGNGAGSFSVSASYYTSGISVSDAICEDFDNDGNVDVGILYGTSNNVIILKSNASGIFGSATTYTLGSSPNTIASKDLNNDGFKDLVVGYNGVASIDILLNNGLGLFPTNTSYITGSNSTSLDINDFNNDGKQDIICGGIGSGNYITTFFGNNTGIFLNSVTQNLSINNATAIEIVSDDFNNDGAIDFATANSSSFSTSHVFINAPIPTITLTSSKNSICIGDTITLKSYGTFTSYLWVANNFGSLTGDSITEALMANWTYTVTGTGAFGCTNSTTKTITVNPLPIISISGDTLTCANRPVTLTVVGANTYIWSNNSLTPTITVSPTVNTTYSVVGTNTNTCKNSATFTIGIYPIPSPLLPTISISGNTLTCANKPVILTATGANTYTWSNGSLTPATIVTQTINTTYSVVGTNSNTCINPATYNVSIYTPPTPQICMVTTDSLSNYNEVYWTKTNYPMADSFFVYREISTNIFIKIGGRAYADSSMFIDTLRSIGPNNGNPNITYYKYKIALKDSCGTVSGQSNYHTTVNVYEAPAGTFHWNFYDIETTGSPVTNYRLGRRNTLTNTEYTVGYTSGNILTDPTYGSLNLNDNIWYVDAISPVFHCDPLLKQTNPMETLAQKVKTKSNVKNDRAANTNGIPSINFANTFFVAPNPAKTEISISFNKDINIKTEIYIMDVLGKTLILNEIESGRIIITPINELSTGIYFITIKQGRNSCTKKFVKE
jgi:hypothetical protein